MKLCGIRPWRRLVQLGVALAFIAIPVLNKAEINILSGNFLSFNFAGLPLSDPLASLQAGLGALSATPAMLAGAGLALLLAAAMGPVFCSWICPFGFFSELAHRDPKTLDTRSFPPASKLPFRAKALIAVTGLLAVLLFAPVPLLNQLSMPGWYSRAMQHAVLYRDTLLGAALLLPAVLLAEKLSGKRFWCRYVCPQSVLIALAGLLIPRRFRVRFRRSACTCPASERACLRACSLDLNPRRPGPPQLLQCSNCGDCVDACSQQGGALSLGFRRLPEKTKTQE